MKKMIVLLAACLVASMALVATAAADTGAEATATPYACWFEAESPYTPHCFDNTATNADGSATAGWGAGDILSLTKDAPTEAYLVAGAVVNGFAGDPLFQLSFDVRGYCGAGAPRFNVYTDGGADFFGCAYGTHIDLGGGWTHVEFGCGDPGSNDALCFEQLESFVTIDGIELVQDEQGTTALRNISVNGLLIGPPPPPAEVTPPIEAAAVPQDNRVGYCAATSVKRPGQDDGRFLDLLIGQNNGPEWKSANAVPAFKRADTGAITCDLPAGFRITGQTDGIYPLISK